MRPKIKSIDVIRRPNSVGYFITYTNGTIKKYARATGLPRTAYEFMAHSKFIRDRRINETIERYVQP